ncbi:PQQ-binding-like beta-propeller repeat protein [Fibrobacterota bacterium]
MKIKGKEIIKALVGGVNYPVLAFVLFFLAASSFGAPWSTFRGNPQRTGFYPGKVGAPASGSLPLWTASLGGPIVSSPSIFKGVLYVGSRDNCFYALEVESGEIIWKVETGGWVDASPYVNEDMIVIASRDGNIYTLKRENGELLSTMPAGLQLSSPVVYQKNLVLSGLGPPVNSFTAYHLDKSVWQFVDEAWILPFTQMSYSSPAIKENHAVIGSSDGKLHAVDITTGERIWTAGTNGGVYISTPAIDDSVVYFAPGNYDENVYSYRLKSETTIGSPLWKRASVKKTSALRKRSNVRRITPSKMREIMRYSPQHRRKVLDNLRKRGYAMPTMLVKKAAGKKSISWSPEGDLKTSSVAVGPRNVFVIQKHLGRESVSLVYKPWFNLVAFDKKTGQARWEFGEVRHSVKLGYASSPIVANLISGGQVVYFGWGEGHVYAMKSSGDSSGILWHDKLDDHVISSPAISDGKVFFATMGGKVAAYAIAEIAQTQNFKEETYVYPNPVRGTRDNVLFHVGGLPEASTVKVEIYNMAERPVKRITETVPSVGGDIRWNLQGVANGVYFAKVTAKYSLGKETEWLKIAIIRK